MITRKIDISDPRVGFVSEWVSELAKNLEHITVITWQEGSSQGLPENVTVQSLAHKKGIFKVAALKMAAFKALRGASGLFCHQMVEYTIIAGPLARMLGKRVVTWYTHGTVSFRLRLAAFISNRVVTASRESCRIRSKKVRVTGHGINTERFTPSEKKHESKGWWLLTVGRISPTKDYESMIKALYELRKQGDKHIHLSIIGDIGLPQHRAYLESLIDMRSSMGLTEVLDMPGALPHKQIPDLLTQADVFINLSGTGSLDKAVLEAMASGCLPLTSNDAFKKILPKELLTKQNNPSLLAQKIQQLQKMSDAQKQELRQKVRDIVVEHHSVSGVAKNIIAQFET